MSHNELDEAQVEAVWSLHGFILSPHDFDMAQSGAIMAQDTIRMPQLESALALNRLDVARVKST